MSAKVTIIMPIIIFAASLFILSKLRLCVFHRNFNRRPASGAFAHAYRNFVIAILALHIFYCILVKNIIFVSVFSLEDSLLRAKAPGRKLISS